MTAYRKNKAKRGYNPFDYPEEWDFFKYPFEEDDEEDDILTELLFQIRKMTRRLHLFFDEFDYNRLETAFYFGLLDSLSEAEDYLFGALKYARFCRLESLFFLEAHDELGSFLEKLGKLQYELLAKIRSFGGSTVELNKECYEDNLFLHLYCDLTQHGIPDDMLHALLRAPDFPFGSDKNMIIDKNTDILSYLENVAVLTKLTEEEKNIEGACDSSKMETMLDPVDKLLWHIRGTLLWLVIKKVLIVCTNAAAIANRHNKLVETMYQEAYKEVCDVYARSKAYAKRRDEEIPRQCREELFIQGRKPTDIELYSYFNTQYRPYIMAHNQSQQLFLQYRKQEKAFCVEFLNMLLDENKREDAEDFLFFQTFGKELSAKQMRAKHERDISPTDEISSVTQTQITIPIVKAGTVITDELKINDKGYPHFPEFLSLETSTNLYFFLSGKNPQGIQFIDGDKTPLADFNYLMGAASYYTTPGKPKPIWWLKNKQMLREMIKLAFAPLLENGTTQNSLAEFVPQCYFDEEGNPLILAKEDKRRIVFQELNVLQNFFAAYSRPTYNT